MAKAGSSTPSRFSPQPSDAAGVTSFAHVSLRLPLPAARQNHRPGETLEPILDAFSVSNPLPRSPASSPLPIRRLLYCSRASPQRHLSPHPGGSTRMQQGEPARGRGGSPAAAARRARARARSDWTSRAGGGQAPARGRHTSKSCVVRSTPKKSRTCPAWQVAGDSSESVAPPPALQLAAALTEDADGTGEV